MGIHSVSCYLVLVIALLCTVRSSVYEANSSEDVDFFLAHNPDENGALMFYDEVQESSNPEIGEYVKKVIGIFLNIGEEGRSKDEWVNTLNDKAHLMRVNAFDKDNADAVKKFKVSKTPLVVLLDNGKAIFQEEVGEATYENIKAVLYKPKDTKKEDTKKEEPKKEQPKKEETPKDDKKDADNTTDVVDAAEADLKKAKEISDKAKKQVEDATKELNNAKKQMVEYSKVEEAKKKADEAKKAADEAMKKYQEAKKSMDKKLKEMEEKLNPKPEPKPAPAPIIVQQPYSQHQPYYYPHSYPYQYASAPRAEAAVKPQQSTAQSKPAAKTESPKPAPKPEAPKNYYQATSGRAAPTTQTASRPAQSKPSTSTTSVSSRPRTGTSY